MSSGTNRLLNSIIAMKNGGNSALVKALENANTEAKKEDKKDSKKK